VATVHGHTSGSLGNRFYEWMDRRLLRRFDAVICVSESVRTALLRSGCPDDRLHVIENAFAGVAPLARDTARRALGVDGAARLAGWVGRLSVEKGADLFVDAFAKLAMSDAEAVLIGDGAERARVEAHAAAAGVAARVRFVGQRSRAAQLLTAFDVLVLSSRTEGTPMVLLEAMAAGVPVVAFAVGGVGRLIDASCGWLVPAGDTRALSEAISEALMQADEAKARARVAQRVLEERFGAARWLDELDALWERVVAAGFGHTRRPTFRVPRGA
jgi:glycosyltransferase involved in cell wall biosynthesis